MEQSWVSPAGHERAQIPQNSTARPQIHQDSSWDWDFHGEIFPNIQPGLTSSNCARGGKSRLDIREYFPMEKMIRCWKGLLREGWSRHSQGLSQKLLEVAHGGWDLVGFTSISGAFPAGTIPHPWECLIPAWITLGHWEAPRSRGSSRIFSIPNHFGIPCPGFTGFWG